jgi:hypothetical protein
VAQLTKGETKLELDCILTSLASGPLSIKGLRKKIQEHRKSKDLPGVVLIEGYVAELVKRGKVKLAGSPESGYLIQEVSLI